MPKRIKITLYIILILAIIAVVRLMFGKTSTNTDTPIDTNTKITTGEDIIDNNDGNTVNIETQENTFEDDVMNDLEGLFNENNGYEDVQGEYGFTNLEIE